MFKRSLPRRQLLQSAFAIAAAAQQKQRRPNIVFILVDDLRFDGLSCLGHPYAKTPQIDRIAAEGAIFRNAFVTTPLCSPSRACFLTGQYASRHGVVGNEDPKRFNPISHQLKTWPQQLQKAGYRTAFIGKLHMGNDDSPRKGFDHWVSFKGQGLYTDPPMNVNGEQVKRQGYMTDILNEHALEFVSSASKLDQPFAMILAHKAVHGPFLPAERHQELYPEHVLPKTANRNDDLTGKPMLQLPMPAPARPAVPGKKAAAAPVRNLPRAQMQTLASVDDGVGALLDKLKAVGQLDNTMFIFTSDNGYFWGEHGLGDKRAAYEESIRIPFVVRYPKLAKAGSKVDGMIANIDLAPTMLELAGAEAMPGIQGQSWLPLLRGKKSGREALFLEYMQEVQFPRIKSWQAVRTPDWKYIHYPELQGADELYDLKRDAVEMKNRIGDAECAKVLAKLRERLERDRRSAGV